MPRALLVLALALVSGCHRERRQHPSEPTSAPLSSAMRAANAQALKAELTRTRERVQAQRDLRCQALLSEPADLELCRTATAAVEQAGNVSDARPTAEVSHELGEAALALTRLLERVRFLGFGDMMRRRVEHDGASAPAASASAAPVAQAARVAGAPPAPALGVAHDRKLVLEQSPFLQEAQSLLLLERQLLRGLGAYLEYGPPETRETALSECKRLVDVHPKFHALDLQLKEASVLETDPTRKATLEALAERALPNGARPAPESP